jgi:hypothetical protein
MGLSSAGRKILVSRQNFLEIIKTQTVLYGIKVNTHVFTNNLKPLIITNFIFLSNINTTPKKYFY